MAEPYLPTDDRAGRSRQCQHERWHTHRFPPAEEHHSPAARTEIESAREVAGLTTCNHKQYFFKILKSNECETRRKSPVQENPPAQDSKQSRARSDTHLVFHRMHAESFRMHEKSFRMHEKSFRMHEKSFRMHEKSFRMHEKSFRMPEESFRMHEKSFRMLEESFRMTKKSFRMHQELRHVDEKSFQMHEKSNQTLRVRGCPWVRTRLSNKDVLNSLTSSRPLLRRRKNFVVVRL